VQSIISQAPSSLNVEDRSNLAQPGATAIDQPLQIDARFQQALLQQAEDMRQAGVRFQVPGSPAAPVQPINTPAPPLGNAQSIISQAPSSLGAGVVPQPAQPAATTTDQLMQGDAQIEQALLQHAEAMRQAGVRFSATSFGTEIVKSASPQSPSAETCRNMLLNPQMDVTEFGDGTGSIDYWTIMDQKIYYDTNDYNSPYYSLVMVDETDGSDTVILDANTDRDAFGQGFQAPNNLTFLQISYSRLYNNENSDDDASYVLWTLDNDGYLDTIIAYWYIGAGIGWSDRQSAPLDSSDLAQASGKSLALAFYLISNRTSPSEIVWLDDAQVELCYTPGANKVYLPLTIKQPASTGPVCSPYEPDSATQRGSTVVNAACDGSFNATDLKDYYSLTLDGVTNIRLRLYNLPLGTNWDAMIYEDASGYPLACHIGTTGAQDKHKDCTLNASKNYFVLVSAGTAPDKGSNTYQMSVEQQ